MNKAERKLEFIKDLHWGYGDQQKPENCKEDECSLCGILLCPHGEPMHLHHDGCPAEYLPHKRTPDCEKWCRHHPDDPVQGCPHPCEHEFAGTKAECVMCGERARQHDASSGRCWCGGEAGSRGHVWGYDG